MNRFFTLFLAASCLTAVGQVTYPYNPDGNADGDIAVGDLQDFLVTYGNPFSPSEIMVGDSSLTYWVEQLSQTVQEQQEMINLLKGGDSRSLLYPDGLSGLLPIHHQFQQDGNFLIPPNKNLYITNYQGGSGDLFADNYLLISAPSSSPVKFSSPIKLASGTLITSTSFSTNDDSFVGFLVDRRVEPVTINIREESFTVPTGKYFVLNYFAVSEVGNSKLYVNGSETSTDANGGFGYWTHPSALTFGAGDILSPQQYVDNSQFNLFGYLVDEDYFDTPLQELEEETTLTIDWQASETGSTFNVTGNVDRIVVNIPTTVPAEWAIHANSPVNGSYVHYMEFQDISDFVLSNGVSHLSWVTPSFPAAMYLDLSGITANEVVIEWDRIESKQSTYLPYLDSLYQELSFICSFSFLNHGFPLVITNLDGLESPHFALNYDYAFSNNGANESLQINTDEGYNGQPFKRFKKLMSGHWVNEVND